MGGGIAQATDTGLRTRGAELGAIRALGPLTALKMVLVARDGYAGPVIAPPRLLSLSGLRLFAYAILALSLLLRPVLASVGEIHELAHDPSGSHLDVASVDGSSHHEEGGEEEGGGSAALHSLLHFAHCCGQVSAAAVAVAFDGLPQLTASRAREPLDAALALARWQSPFRPPITT